MRAVCDALRLDSAVEEEVLELRHNLLRLTHTREFAQAAQFKVLPVPFDHGVLCKLRIDNDMLGTAMR